MNSNESQFFSTKKAIIKWLDKHKVKNYTINDDLSVDVNGDVNIFNKSLKIIPIKFRNITGDFWCGHNKLTSLAGFSSAFALSSVTFPSVRSPRYVGGNFNCSNNKLTSLAGSPETVGGDFNCGGNQLTGLAGSPETVGCDFWCQNNKLINLSGLPISVKGDFWCDDNKLMSLLEIMNCNFKEKIYFNIDKDNFKQKELIQILKKYYNSKYEFYELTNRQFHDIIEPVLEKETLQQKLINSRIKKKIKTSFI